MKCPSCGQTIRVPAESIPTLEEMPTEETVTERPRSSPPKDLNLAPKKTRGQLKQRPKSHGLVWVLAECGLVLLLLVAGGIWWATRGSPTDPNLPSENSSTPGPQVFVHNQDGSVGPFATLQEPVYQAAFLPNSKQILSCSGASVRLWDVATKQQLRVLEAKDYSCVALSPAGDSAVLGSFKGGLRLLDLASWRETVEFAGHQGNGRKMPITGVAWSPTGNYIVSTGRDFHVRLWDAKTGRLMREYEQKDSHPLGVTFLPDGHRFLVGYESAIVRLYSIDAERQLQQYPTFRSSNNRICACRPLPRPPEEKLIVAGGSEIQTWKIDGTVLGDFKKHTRIIESIALSRDGQRLLSGGEDLVVRLWDLKSGDEIMSFSGYTQKITSVAMSPDGKQGLSTSDDNSIRVFALPESGGKPETKMTPPETTPKTGMSEPAAKITVFDMESKTLPSLKLVRIAAKGKSFTMGTPGGGSLTNDEIEHEVTFSQDYYLGVHAVTTPSSRRL